MRWVFLGNLLWMEKVLKKAIGYPCLRANSHNLSSVFPLGVKTRPLGWIISEKGDGCVNHKLEGKPE